MSSRAQRARASQSRLIKQHGDGGKVTIRKRSTLIDQLAGDPILDIEVAGTFAPGVSLITLGFPNLVGKLIAGVEFVLEGDATTYTTTGDTEANAAGALIDVPFTPDLVVGQSSGNTCTLAGDTVDISVDGLVTKPVEDTLQGQRVEADNRMVIFDVTKLQVEIELSDEIVTGGVVYVIQSELPVQPNLEKFALRLLVGRR